MTTLQVDPRNLYFDEQTRNYQYKDVGYYLYSYGLLGTTIAIIREIFTANKAEAQQWYEFSKANPKI